MKNTNQSNKRKYVAPKLNKVGNLKQITLKGGSLSDGALSDRSM